MLGFGIAANYAWQTFLTQRMGKKRYRALCDRLWYYQVSRALTLSYFVVAVTCIWIAPEQTAAIGTPVGLAICAAAMIVLAVAGTVGGIVFDTIKARILGQGQRPRLARILAIFTLCLLCILILDAGLRSAIAAQINSVPHLYAATGRFIFFFLAGAIGYGALDPLAERLRQPLHNPGFNPIIGGSWIGVRLLILVNFAILMANDVPEFVYKVF
jgi:p-aminobenzoyl-glutamate transporter AbgT